MACPKCGSAWQFIDGVLRCPSCTMIAPFQPLPTYEELLKKLEEAQARIKELENERKD